MTEPSDSRLEPNLEPTTRRYLDALLAQGGPALYTLSPAAARTLFESLQAANVAEPEGELERRILPVGPTGQTAIRVFRPRGATGSLPVIVYFHGGGWVLGGWETHARLVRELARGARAAAVFVEYDRAPEARYPIAIEQAFAVTKYVVEHGGEWGLDVGRLAVAGDSAGGNMATVTALLAERRRGPRIKAQVLYYPVTDSEFDTDSYRQFADGPWLLRDAMRWFWDNYLPDHSARREPTASPLRAELAELASLPPCLVITAENDVLRDEGEAYARRLAEAGVPVAATRFLGVIHDFVLINELRPVPAAAAAIEMAAAFLGRALAN